MAFAEKYVAAVIKNQSLVCVGLDTNQELIPSGISVTDFNKAIIDATADLVCCYKPNIAFYEAQGEKGLDALTLTVQYIPKDIPVICDAKRADIGNTSEAYARAVFQQLKADAVTVSPYLGFDSVEPFFKNKDYFSFLLCRTSNKGAADFQSLLCDYDGKQQPLYEIVAQKADKWNTQKNIGLVVGATYPEELRNIRRAHPDMILLIPGVGAQGGDLKQAVSFGIDKNKRGIIINSSRQILYASKGADFAIAARKAAQALRDDINKCLAEIKA
jgi:orotidine-5'-phosphate decarboxylase